LRLRSKQLAPDVLEAQLATQLPRRASNELPEMLLQSPLGDTTCLREFMAAQAVQWISL
jgi:hypothetical protein